MIPRNRELVTKGYRKAKDMVPHGWIIEFLEFLQIADNIKQFITISMTQRETEQTSSGESLEKVNMRRGLFQGRTLSPLLFTIFMVPLTLVLREILEGKDVWITLEGAGRNRCR